VFLRALVPSWRTKTPNQNREPKPRTKTTNQNHESKPRIKTTKIIRALVAYSPQKIISAQPPLLFSPRRTFVFLRALVPSWRTKTPNQNPEPKPQIKTTNQNPKPKPRIKATNQYSKNHSCIRGIFPTKKIISA
jgi:hypothetical protein